MLTVIGDAPKKAQKERFLKCEEICFSDRRFVLGAGVDAGLP